MIFDSIFRKSPESIVADAEADGAKLFGAMGHPAAEAAIRTKHGYLLARVRATGMSGEQLVILLIQIFGPLVVALLTKLFDRWFRKSDGPMEIPV